MIALWAGCRDNEGGREDKPGRLFLDRDRLGPTGANVSFFSALSAVNPISFWLKS
jgi:hypothetical protein